MASCGTDDVTEKVARATGPLFREVTWIRKCTRNRNVNLYEYVLDCKVRMQSPDDEDLVLLSDLCDGFEC